MSSDYIKQDYTSTSLTPDLSRLKTLNPQSIALGQDSPVTVLWETGENPNLIISGPDTRQRNSLINLIVAQADAKNWRTILLEIPTDPYQDKKPPVQPILDHINDTIQQLADECQQRINRSYTQTDNPQPILLIFNDFSSYIDTIWLTRYPSEQIPDDTRTQIQRTSEQLFDLMTRARHANIHIILAGRRLTRPDTQLPREYRQSDLALAVSARISIGGNPLHALVTKDIHDDLNDPWKFKKLAEHRHRDSPFGYAVYQTVDRLLYCFDLYDDGDIVRD